MTDSANGSILARFEALLESLVGLECWALYAGRTTGSMFIADFGRRIPRRCPLRNSYISQEQRELEGEFHLYATDCSWRLETPNEMICGSADDYDNADLVFNGLLRLEGQRLRSYELAPVSLDLVLAFDNDLTLRLLCNMVNPVDEKDNYRLADLTTIYSVGARSQLTVSERGEP